MEENDKYKVAKEAIHQIYGEAVDLLKKEFCKYKELNKINKVNVFEYWW